MPDYQSITGAIFDEPEWEDPTEIVVYVYILTHRDMAGVCQIHEKSVAAKCRTSVRKLIKVLTKFEESGKIMFAINRKAVWLQSGINHSLYKGHFTTTQMSVVKQLLTKWENTGIFGSGFALHVTQVYATKYKIVIPYSFEKHGAITDTDTDTDTDTELILKVKGNLPTPLNGDSAGPLIEPPQTEPPRLDFSNPFPEGSKLPPPPTKSEEPEKRGQPVRLKVQIAGIIKQAFTNKFHQELPDSEIIRLINGNEHFPGFGKAENLLFAISKISPKMEKPVGTLIDFTKSPAKYLSKAEDYDQWKQLTRNMAVRSP